MISSEVFLILMIAVPAVCALLMLCFPAREAFKPLYEGLHLISVAFAGVVSIILAVQVIAGGVPLTAWGGMIRLDALGAIFCCLIGVLALLVGVMTLPYTRFDLERGAITLKHFRTYYVFFELFVFAMLTCAAADNVMLMWIAIEATMLATIFLVSTYGKKTSLEAAWKYLVVCSVGVAFGLYGVVLVFADAHAVMDNAADAMLWSAMMPHAEAFDPRLMQIAFVFIAIGFGTKAGLFPMFTWVPDADAEAPAPVSALLSGVLMAVAMMVIMRFYGLVGAAAGFFFPQLVMFAMGILTVLVGAFGLYRQKNLMRKFAYSSCENMGVVAVGLGIGGPLGIAAAILHAVFHGFVKCLMFCLCGNVNMGFGNHDLDRVKAVLRVMPLTGVLLAFGLFALSGFPGFALFITEAMTIIAGVVASPAPVWFIIMALFALALSVVVAGLGKVITYNVLGPKPSDEDALPARKPSVLMLVPEFVMLAMVMWFGFYTPQLIATGVEESVIAITRSTDDAVLHDAPLFNYVFHGTDSPESQIDE